MSRNLTVNGNTYVYPDTGEENWGQDTTDWAEAVTNGMLQKAGGTFTLTAEVDFGALFGIKSLYYKSRTANPASAGQIRLANADTIKWRNAANSGDVSLSVNSSDEFVLTALSLTTLTVSGVTTLNGNIVLGSDSSDLITPNGRLHGSLIPDVNNSYNSGDSSFRWSTVYGVDSNFTGTSTLVTILSSIYKSGTANPASAGIIRLANLDDIRWRNAANSGDVSISVNASNQFLLGGPSVPSSSGVYDLGTSALKWRDLYGAVFGTITNDSAAAGRVGEYIESVISTQTNVPAATTVWGNMTTVSLTAGDWDVTGVASYFSNGATVVSPTMMAVSVNSGITTTDHVDGSNQVETPATAASNNRSTQVPSYRLSLSGATTVYLKVNITFSVATPQYQCRLSARRVR